MNKTMKDFHLTDKLSILQLSELGKGTPIKMLFRTNYKGKNLVQQNNFILEEVFKTKENPTERDFMISAKVLGSPSFNEDGTPNFDEKFKDDKGEPKIIHQSINFDGTIKYMERGRSVIGYVAKLE